METNLHTKFMLAQVENLRFQTHAFQLLSELAKNDDNEAVKQHLENLTIAVNGNFKLLQGFLDEK